MAAPIYCTHQELKRVFPQLDSFDGKTTVYGFTESSTNLYRANDVGLVNTVFVDGRELGAAESALLSLNAQDEWFFDSTSNSLFLYTTTDPNSSLIEVGEDFTTVVTQFRTDASRYLDSMLDPNMPKEAWKDRNGNYDYILIRTTALIAANFMIKSHDPNSELANALMEEAMMNINNINQGKAALSWQTTRDSSQGVVRDVTYTSTGIRPIDTRGEWRGSYDLIKVIITKAGVLGVGMYSVYIKDDDKLKNNLVVENEVINGDYQPLAGGMQIRFGGPADNSTARSNDEWEIEVFGAYEETDASNGRAVKMTRTRKMGSIY